MAKKDWTLIDFCHDEDGCEPWFELWQRVQGDRSCYILCYGNWRESCQLQFAKFNKRLYSWERVTVDGGDWFDPDNREGTPEFKTCFWAEKAALKWLKGEEFDIWEQPGLLGEY